MSISLRIAQASDLNLIRQWRNHPDIRKYMFTQHEIDPAEHAAWFNRWAEDPTRLVLLAEDSGMPIGLVTLKNVAPLSDAEWGFYVQPGSLAGTGRQMCRAALDYAFQTLGVARVIGRVLEGNFASERLHRRMGFCMVQDSVEQPEAAAECHRAQIFALRREQWLAPRTD